MPSTRRRTRTTQNNSAPVNRIPDEILAEVFLLGLPIFEEGEAKAGLECIRYLSTISSICGLWRRVAIGLPRLWTSIVFSKAHHDPKTGLERVKAYLKRSGACLLRVSVDFHDGRAESTPMARVLRQHSHRFVLLRLSVTTLAAARLLLPINWRFDNLHRLGLNLAFWGQGVIFDRDVEFEILAEGSNAPLRTLEVTNALPCFFAHVPTSLLKIVRITSTIARGEQLLALLARSSQLEFASLDFYDTPLYPEDIDPIDHFELPSLTQLSIVTAFPLTFPTRFTAQNLTHLRLFGHESHGPRWPASPYPTWNALRDVEFHSMTLPLDGVLHLFNANPTIEHLSFIACDSTMAFQIILANLASEDLRQIPRDDYLDHLLQLIVKGTTRAGVAGLGILPLLQGVTFKKCQPEGNSNLTTGHFTAAMLKRRPSLTVFTDAALWEGSHLSIEDVGDLLGDHSRVQIVS